MAAVKHFNRSRTGHRPIQVPTAISTKGFLSLLKPVRGGNIKTKGYLFTERELALISMALVEFKHYLIENAPKSDLLPTVVALADQFKHDLMVI